MTSRKLLKGKGRASVSAWTPASISTDIWYDADNAGSITHVGGAVSQWNDQSINGRHAFQANATYKPTYATGVQNGKPGILMNQNFNPPGSGDGSFIQIPAFTRAQPFIVCAAFKVRTRNSWSTVWDCDAITGSGGRNMLLSYFDDASNNSGITNGSGTAYGGGLLANNTAHILVGVFDGVSSAYRKDGVGIAISNLGSVAISITGMLGSWVPNSAADGWHLEFFIIPGNSTTDITNAETYLAAKWAI